MIMLLINLCEIVTKKKMSIKSLKFIAEILEISCGSESFSWALRCDLWYNMYDRYYVRNGVLIDMQT